MCCLCFCCMKFVTDVLAKPFVFSCISMGVALVHLIILACQFAPFSHCEEATLYHHESLILYESLNCSKINAPVLDNCVALSLQFDLLHLYAAWIILNALMIISCIILLIGLCVPEKCCVGAFCVLPYIVVSSMIIVFDIVLMILIVQTYKSHGSYLYFLQMIGLKDKMTTHLFLEHLGVEQVITVTRMKMSNLFYRLLYHSVAVIFVYLAIKHFLKKMCNAGGRRGGGNKGDSIRPTTEAN